MDTNRMWKDAKKVKPTGSGVYFCSIEGEGTGRGLANVHYFDLEDTFIQDENARGYISKKGWYIIKNDTYCLADDKVVMWSLPLNTWEDLTNLQRMERIFPRVWIDEKLGVPRICPAKLVSEQCYKMNCDECMQEFWLSNMVDIPEFSENCEK